jgi:hypothetical protein
MGREKGIEGRIEGKMGEGQSEEEGRIEEGVKGRVE